MNNSNRIEMLVQGLEELWTLTVEHDLAAVVDTSCTAHHWWRNSAVRETNPRSCREWSKQASRGFPVDDTSITCSVLCNVHCTGWQSGDEDEDRGKGQRSFPRADRVVAAVDAVSTNHTNGDDDSSIDLRRLENGHR